MPSEKWQHAATEEAEDQKDEVQAKQKAKAKAKARAKGIEVRLPRNADFRSVTPQQRYAFAKCLCAQPGSQAFLPARMRAQCEKAIKKGPT